MPRILVLDDEVLISILVEDWLTELGCETVGPANSVPGALGLIDGTGLDGAILDVSLGNGNCYPVADALRDRDIPFAFATGHLGKEIAARFKDALILSKPFDFEAVRTVVTKLLDSRARSSSAAVQKHYPRPVDPRRLP
jgi:CheY-like chemotaxis protein